MPDITKIKIGNERERSYKDFPANREFKKRAEDDNPGGGWPSDLPKPSVGGYGYTDEDDAIHKIDEKYLPEAGGSTLFYVDDTNTDGHLDDTLYLDEDRTIEATLEDIQASVGTVVQLIATSGKIYTPVECMTSSNEYGFVVIQVDHSDGTLKPSFFIKVRLS